MTTEQSEIRPDEGSESALSETELTAAAPEVLANSLGDYLVAWWRRIKNGESGALPVIVGLVLIIIFFEIERPAFLTDNNLINNLAEGAALYVLLGAAETFVLLLSEIDLSIGYGMGIGGFVIAELIAPPVNFPWWLGVICGVLRCLASLAYSGHAHNAAWAAVLHRDARWTAGLPRNHARARQRRPDGGRRRHSDQPNEPDLQARQQQHEPDTWLDRTGRVPRAVRWSHSEPRPIAQSEGAAHPTVRRHRADHRSRGDRGHSCSFTCATTTAATLAWWRACPG